MDEAKVSTEIDRLTALLSAREGKCVRNFNRYNNNGVRREDLWNPKISPQAWFAPAVGVDGVQTQINVIKQCVDTITSKISTANTRPFFIPVNGDYDSGQACRKMQDYSDVWLDEQHAYPKSVMCFRDASLFEVGIMHVNAEEKSLERVPTWEYMIDPVEYMAGTITRVVRWRKYFPLAALKERIENKDLKKKLDEDPTTQGRYAIYWDLYNGYKYEQFDGKYITDGLKLDYEQYGGLYRRPFVELFYTKPLKGFYSTSLADDLYPVQRQIDEMVKRFDLASRKSPLQMIFVPKGNGVKASLIDNGTTVYEYNPSEAGGNPVTLVNPVPLAPEFLDLLKLYLDQAFNIAGISQLSAQSQKPPGLNSGKALDTMEDIESDRFNVQLQQYTHFQVDVMRVVIDCFPKGDRVVETMTGGDKITWGDIRKQHDMYKLQFSAASSLSKNPEEKRNEIQFMASVGLIDQSQIADFYEMPDLNAAGNASTAAYHYCMRIIDRAIKEGDIEYIETVDLSMLQRMTVQKLNQMEAANDDPKYISRLLDLLDRVTKDKKTIDDYNAPRNNPPPPEPLREEALDSGQIQALTAIVEKVKAGSLDSTQAIALVSLAYPKLDPKRVLVMFQPPPPPQAAAPPGPTAPQPINQGVPNA